MYTVWDQKLGGENEATFFYHCGIITMLVVSSVIQYIELSSQWLYIFQIYHITRENLVVLTVSQPMAEVEARLDELRR